MGRHRFVVYVLRSGAFGVGDNREFSLMAFFVTCPHLWVFCRGGGLIHVLCFTLQRYVQKP